MHLLLSDARGIYIPRDFAELYGEYLSEEQKFILAHPEDDSYWDVWAEVVDNVEIDIDGKVYRLHQDGDLWAYRLEDMTLEQQFNFFEEEVYTPEEFESMTIQQWMLVPLMYGDLSGLNTREEKDYFDFVELYGDDVRAYHEVGFDVYMGSDAVQIWIKLPEGESNV